MKSGSILRNVGLFPTVMWDMPGVQYLDDGLNLSSRWQPIIHLTTESFRLLTQTIWLLTL